MTAGDGSPEKSAAHCPPPDPSPTGVEGSAAEGDASIQIQPRPTPPVSSIEAAPPPISEPSRFQDDARRLDPVMILLTLAFGFFLASFAATNADLWAHLASGRLVAHGQFHFPFADDPFVYSVGGAAWLDHNWLYDLVIYGVSQVAGGPESAAGGAAMILFKAAIAVALAYVMLLIRRPGDSAWLPVVCVSLALLALSPRLLLQPTCISFLFLALTLLLLQTGGRGSCRAVPSPVEPARQEPRPPKPGILFMLPILFALWANLDGWFLLGPAVVGLYLIGEFLHDRIVPVPAGAEPERASELKRLAAVFALGLAACILNPYHVRAFAVPPELATFLADSPLSADKAFAGFFASPLQASYFNKPVFYQNPAGCAYLALLAVGLLSFACNYQAAVSGRGLVFLVLAALSAWWVRAVPFFAVVAGPIAALNFQDFAAALATPEPAREGRRKRAKEESRRSLAHDSRRWALTGRLITIVGLAALLALTWFGLLHPYADKPYANHRVAWHVAINPSLRDSARALAALHERGILQPDSHAFNLNPDVASYYAWFCPQEKCFLDRRLFIYDPDTADIYVKARRALAMQLAPGEKFDPKHPPAEEWRAPFRQQRVDHVILHDVSWESLREPALVRFWRHPKEWTVLYADGRTLIFGWNDPKSAAPRFKEHVADPVRAAFALADNAGRAEGVSPLSAPSGDSSLGSADSHPAPTTENWWDAYLQFPQAKPLGVDRAAMYGDQYTIVQAHRREVYAQQFAVSRWLGPAFGAAGSTATGAGSGAGPFLGAFTVRWPIAPRPLPSATAAALPLLATRAAREAVRAQPNDAACHLALANALRSLNRDQHDMLADNDFGQTPNSPLDEIRRVQLINILERCVLLKPDAPEPHYFLAEVYLRLDGGDPRFPSHMDYALQHYAQWLALSENAGPRGDETGAQFDARIQAMQKIVRNKVSTHVSIRRAAGQMPGSSLTPEEMNTPDKFLDRLQQNYALKAENRPLLEKINIALQYGLAKQALKIVNDLDAERQRQLSDQEGATICMLSIRAGRAHEISDDILIALRAERVYGIPKDWLRVLKAAALGDYDALDEHLDEFDRAQERQHQNLMLQWGIAPFGAAASDPRALHNLASLTMSARRQCDLRVLRGLMLLERGDNVRARQAFETSLRRTVPVRQVLNLAGGLSATQPLDGVAFLAAWSTIAPAERPFYFDFAVLARTYLQHLDAAAGSDRVTR